jgi:hypothetical protein
MDWIIDVDGTIRCACAMLHAADGPRAVSEARRLRPSRGPRVAEAEVRRERFMEGLLTDSTLAGLLLAVGAAVGGLMTGLATTRLGAVWTSPSEVSLRLIAEHPGAWRIANLGFAVMTVSTVAGLWTVPDLVGDQGASLALAAAGAYALASGFWVVSLAVRLAVQPDVAASFVEGGTIDPAYRPLARVSGGLFIAFESIAGASLIALGAAILVGGSMAAVLGWFAIAIGALLVVTCATAGGTLPAFVYLPTFAMGVALLLGVH